MLRTLFGFGGRLSRPGFIEALVSILLVDVAALLVGKYVEAYGVPWGPAAGSPVAGALAQAIPIVFGVLTAWALLAIVVKRLHDRGRSAWWVILLAIPVIGWLWLLVDLLLPGAPGKNRHGRAPFSPPEPGWTAETMAAPVAGGAAVAVTAGELDWTGAAGREPSRNGGDPADALAAYTPPATSDPGELSDGPLVLDAPPAPAPEPEPEPEPAAAAPEETPPVAAAPVEAPATPPMPAADAAIEASAQEPTASEPASGPPAPAQPGLLADAVVQAPPPASPPPAAAEDPFPSIQQEPPTAEHRAEPQSQSAPL